MDFQNRLLSWYKVYKRDLPWRNTTDPYIIWLSEVILQQTRVNQGMPYFFKFLEAFPTVTQFANANEETILKLWQGLGYYSRARNMHSTAKYIVDHYKGNFPTDYHQLIKLKGIGPYSAAAISSFSSNAAFAVVDGNVFRVLSRYFGIEEPINSTKGIKVFNELANELLYEENPGLYNQAIMEFGALQCVAKNPNCSVCPLAIDCVALKGSMVVKLPVKLPKAVKKVRHIYYFVCRRDNKILVRHRQAGDIWQHLFDFPSIEVKESEVDSETVLYDAAKVLLGENSILSFKAEYKHILTHQIIKARFLLVDDFFDDIGSLDDCTWVSLKKLHELPQPKLINSFIESFL